VGDRDRIEPLVLERSSLTARGVEELPDPRREVALRQEQAVGAVEGGRSPKRLHPPDLLAERLEIGDPLFRGSRTLLAAIVLFNLANVTFFSAALPGPEELLARHPAALAPLVLAQIVVTLVVVGVRARSGSRAAASAEPSRSGPPRAAGPHRPSLPGAVSVGAPGTKGLP
jgi:hypothetical protein